MDTEAALDNLQQALHAYQSPMRTHYPLNQRRVSNLEATIYFLTKAQQQQPDQVKTLLTLATMHTFQGDINTALELYRQCLTRSRTTTEQRRALTYLLTWYHYQHDHPQMTIAFTRLQKLDSQYAGFLNRVLRQIETVLAQPISIHTESLPKNTQYGANHAFITLGYKLKPDGTLAFPLVSRLVLTKQLSRLSPTSQILVTGGAPQQGRTEAQQMKRWLIEKRIDKQRIIVEHQATNTIDNASFSLALLHQRGIRHATVISNAAHVQRSQLLFQVLQLDSDQPTITVDHCALPEPHADLRNQTETIKRNCYIDVLRAIGLPAFDCPPFVGV